MLHFHSLGSVAVVVSGAAVPRYVACSPPECSLCLQGEANELEVEMLLELQTHLLLEAGSIYRQGADDGWPDDDTPAGDDAAWSAAAEAATEEEEDSEADSEVGDEGEAAHKAAAKRSKAKGAGFRLTKAGVLVGFVVLILLAEIVVFLDMAGLLGSR